MANAQEWSKALWMLDKAQQYRGLCLMEEMHGNIPDSTSMLVNMKGDQQSKHEDKWFGTRDTDMEWK